MKVSISVNVQPENEKESKDNQNSYQNFNYTLGGYKVDLDISQLDQIVRDWLAKQKK